MDTSPPDHADVRCTAAPPSSDMSLFLTTKFEEPASATMQPAAQVKVNPSTVTFGDSDTNGFTGTGSIHRRLVGTRRIRRDPDVRTDQAEVLGDLYGNDRWVGTGDGAHNSTGIDQIDALL